MSRLFEDDAKSRVAQKIMEGNFRVREGNYARALTENQLDMSVTKLRRALGFLISERYVRRFRFEPGVHASYAANADDARGIALSVVQTLEQIHYDVRRDPYEPNREVWLYEPTSKLDQLQRVQIGQPRATFAH